MRVPVLTGPTGVGKTEVAVILAERLDIDLVSADSRQVYCWLDIGTAKPARSVRERVKYHMLDMVEPTKRYSAADFARDCRAVMHRLGSEGRKFMLVGGSGMYIRAVFRPFFEAPRPDPELRAGLEKLDTPSLLARLRTKDPARAAQLHPNDRQRIVRALEVQEQTGRPMSELLRESAGRQPFEPAYFVLSMDRARLHRRIDERFDRMMSEGLLDEVRQLSELGLKPDSDVADAYGYAELLRHLAGEMPLSEAVDRAKAKTRAYARRQLTWCRKLERARWLEFTDAEQTAEQLHPEVRRVLDSPGPTTG